MKILFYGGCHAIIMKRIFEENSFGDHEFAALQNYKLISRCEPFPFEKYSEFDAIVFSPVTRKEYSTDILINFCTENGILPVSYPWVQWQSLYPFASKGRFLGGTSWRYDLTFDGLNDLGPDGVIRRCTGSDLDESIFSNFEISHRKLLDFEERFDTKIRISEFIIENYKTTRLFLTPDHPTQALYCYLVERIAACLGIQISSNFFYSGQEPQAGIKLPLIPRVSDVLDLSYRDADYENNTAFGSTVLSWSDYVSLYTDEDAVILQASNTTQVKRKPLASNILSAAERIPCMKGTLMVASPISIEAGHMRVKPVLLTRSMKKPIPLSGEWFIFTPHWSQNLPGLI